MKVLAIGDITGTAGREYLRSVLPAFKRRNNIDFTVANGENSSASNGISENSARYLFDSGVDVITTGNHVFRRRDAYDFLDSCPFIVRPANFSPAAPGKGYCLYDMGSYQIGVINLAGNLYMDPASNPFTAADECLKQLAGRAKVILVDFHAEATSEKKAMGFYLDGKVSAVFGTHTHVQTSDNIVLPKSTAYITDLGMTGPVNSVLGISPESAVKRFCTGLPTSFAFIDGKCRMNAVIIEIDQSTGKSYSTERIDLSN